MGTTVKAIIGAAALALSLGVAGAAMAQQNDKEGVGKFSNANKKAIEQTATHSNGRSGSPAG